MTDPAPLTRQHRELVAIMAHSASPGLARWIELMLRDGAEIADIQRTLGLALRQIGRVGRHRRAGLPKRDAAAGCQAVSPLSPS